MTKISKQEDQTKNYFSEPFIIHALASIHYEGRAKSWLPPGYYIIIKKPDNSIQIHGAEKTTPINYQRPKSTIEIKNNQIIIKHKNETITINILHIVHQYTPIPWSNNKLEITMTEQHLKQKIIKNINELLQEQTIQTIEEYETPYGPVDIVAITKEIHHIIEIKRAKAQISACTQLLRYLEYFHEKQIKTKGWIMSPTISQKALIYCEKSNITWQEVKH